MSFHQKPLIQKLWLFFAYLAFTFFLYFKVLNFELTFLDDNVWLLDYQWYFADWSNALRFFIQPDFISGMFYRPVLNMSFLLNAQLGGTSPFGYHLANIIIHAVNGCLVFAWFRAFEYDRVVSAVLGFVFLSHPVLTAAVAWIPGRTDSLLAMFVLSSFLCFTKFLAGRKRFWFFWHILFFILGFLVKETAVVLPLLCFFFIFTTAENQQLRKWKDAFIWKRYGSVFSTWLILTAGLLLWRGHVLKSGTEVDVSKAVSSLFANAPLFISYIGKIFLPVNLSVLPVLKDLSLKHGIAVITGLTLMVAFSKKPRWSRMLFGLAWFFGFLLPSLVYSFLAHEYRLYLPMLGMLLLFFETDLAQLLIRRRRAFFAAVTAVLVIFSVTCWRYQNRFENRFRYWESAVATSPHAPLAHRNLGAMYHLEGRIDEAEQEYLKALALNFREPMVHNNLGLIYMNRGEYPRAEKEFILDFNFHPEHDRAYYNLGLLYYRLGRVEDAAKYWKKTLAVNPKYIDAYKSLTVYFYREKDYKHAYEYLTELTRRGIVMPEALVQELEQKLSESK